MLPFYGDRYQYHGYHEKGHPAYSSWHCNQIRQMLVVLFLQSKLTTTNEKVYMKLSLSLSNSLSNPENLDVRPVPLRYWKFRTRYRLVFRRALQFFSVLFLLSKTHAFHLSLHNIKANGYTLVVISFIQVFKVSK